MLEGSRTPFNSHLREQVLSYCWADLPPRNKSFELFSFIQDTDLQTRLVDEYEGARFAYKLFEGLQATDEQMRFQVRSQLLSYASLYEASIEYVLYHYYGDTSEVGRMGKFNGLIKISIPKSQEVILQSALFHDGKRIVPCYEGEKAKDKNAIRFEEKIDTAVKLGIIHPLTGKGSVVVNLPEELKEIYSFRNGIHLLAEQRKDINYEINMSRRAYMRLAPFCQQIKVKLERDGKVNSARASSGEDGNQENLP